MCAYVAIMHRLSYDTGISKSLRVACYTWIYTRQYTLATVCSKVGLVLSHLEAKGRRRLYSQRDIDKIKLVLQLTRKMGINLGWC